MLVLSRRVNESFLLPALGISVEVSSINRSQVRLAIEAPREFKVVRGELPVNAQDFEISDSLVTRLGTNGAKLLALVENEDEISSPGRQYRYSPPRQRTELDTAALQHKLDSANMALYLAQSQLRADQSENADDAVVQAMGLLAEIESLLAKHPTWRSEVTEVKESRSQYETGDPVGWLDPTHTPASVDGLLSSTSESYQLAAT